jgi:hypothetical protein
MTFVHSSLNQRPNVNPLPQGPPCLKTNLPKKSRLPHYQEGFCWQ